MIWSGPPGFGGTVGMTPGAGASYRAVIGPIATDGVNLQPSSYPIAVTVIAKDSVGNEARRDTTLIRAVNHCGLV